MLVNAIKKNWILVTKETNILVKGACYPSHVLQHSIARAFHACHARGKDNNRTTTSLFHFINIILYYPKYVLNNYSLTSEWIIVVAWSTSVNKGHKCTSDIFGEIDLSNWKSPSVRFAKSPKLEKQYSPVWFILSKFMIIFYAIDLHYLVYQFRCDEKWRSTMYPPCSCFLVVPIFLIVSASRWTSRSPN